MLQAQLIIQQITATSVQGYVRPMALCQITPLTGRLGSSRTAYIGFHNAGWSSLSPS
jgi:hypothetical protein